MAEPNWNKHSALSGWANVLVAICGLAIMLYLGLRQSLQVSQPNATAGNPGVGPVMPQWLPWLAASLYAAGVIVAALLHLKAARLTASPSDETSRLRAELKEQTNGCNARDGIITGLREQIVTLQVENEKLAKKAIGAAESIKVFEGIVQGRDEIIADRNKKWRDLEAEKQRAKEAQETVWKLKSEAREIKRLWPGSDFEGRPANKKSWALPHPSSGRVSKNAEYRGWLDRALRWYDQFKAYRFLIEPNDFLLNTLTFDELIELLDADQMAKAGLSTPVPRTNRPIIRARYGKSGRSYGFFLQNIRDDSAFRISVVPFRIGGLRIIPGRTLTSLDREQGEQFIELSFVDSNGGGTINASLYGPLVEWYRSTDSWCSPWPMSVAYRDIDGNGYYSRHEVSLNANDTESEYLIVEYIGDYCLRQLDS